MIRSIREWWRRENLVHPGLAWPYSELLIVALASAMWTIVLWLLQVAR